MMQQISTRDAASLAIGQLQESLLLDEEGRLVDDVVILRESPGLQGEHRFLMVVHQESYPWLAAWLHGLSEGYLVFDTKDPNRRIEGPVRVLEASGAPGTEKRVLAFHGDPDSLHELPCLGGDLSNLSPGHFRALEAGEGVGLLCRQADEAVLWIGEDSTAVGLVAKMQRAGLGDARRDGWESLRARRGLPDHRTLPKMDSTERTGRPTAGELFRCGLSDLFVPKTPYFIGQESLSALCSGTSLPAFSWDPPAGDGANSGRGKGKATVLDSCHKRQDARFAVFSGWRMPLWYQSASEEHRAVREAVGMFDITHMGVLEIRGAHAEEFMDLICTHRVRRCPEGMSFYTFLLDIHGEVLDDVLVYRRTQDSFVVVVNAANHEKILCWLNAVNRAEVAIDRDRRTLSRLRPVEIRDLGDLEESGEDARVAIALQGPRARRTLEDTLDDGPSKVALQGLKRGGFYDGSLRDVPAWISRTGYTGETLGYELFVHPEKAVKIWDILVEKGRPYGLKAAGLAARDSLRVEAGLPLYGHELAGPERLGPMGAGYGAFVHLSKPFFIGRSPCLELEKVRKMGICRFWMTERGVRVPRTGDPVANRKGRIIGRVTSCALGSDGHLTGMACLERSQATPGAPIGVFPLLPRSIQERSDKAELRIGDRVLLHENARILSRFPSARERAEWKKGGERP
jgi:glycine cleavage system T protein